MVCLIGWSCGGRRLDPLPKPGNQGDYRRGNEGFERRGGFSRGGGRYSNDRGNSPYQLASSGSGPSLHSTPVSMYSSALMGGGRKANDGVSLAGVTPEVMSAAAQVLQNINKQVGLTNLPLPNRSSPQVNMATQLQQIAAAQRMAPASFEGSPYAQFGYPPPGKKLPPEGERYNRRMGRSSGHHDNMSHDLFKNPQM
ncbi:uncharacterized protein LOC135336207 [Halichondria panicea]|uniref:uncharacterized protein LOC135336207 n=1 Tax=Halichondria panicea TaxID=6063 RepID=UPI00312B4202